MSSPSSEHDPLNPLAEEFLARYRRGERPALSEYTDRHPELASQIRELFPALVALEAVGSVEGQATGPDISLTREDGSVPRQLGDYRILREVGRGRMGVVYEAVQESLGRHVALKVLPLHGLASATHLERFRREAQAAARLHHSNIVPVFGVGEHHGIHYYAMQFIQGQGLDLVLRELQCLRGRPEAPPAGGPQPNGPVCASVAQGLLTGRFQNPAVAREESASGAVRGFAPSPDSQRDMPSGSGAASSHSELTSQPEAQYFRSVARLGVQVAEALDYAHRQGILHRDIKPSNLLLDTQGTVWITDFGLAKADDTEALTSPGDIVGTLRYLAPERLQGKSDRRGDIYSLGLTLYELLTLRPAFVESNRARLIERVTHEEPPRPRQLDGRIPRDLETIVLKAMDKEPGRRYATAGALAEDLRRFLADRPIQARRTAQWERAWRWCRRNPVVASLTATVVLILVAVTLSALMAAVQFRRIAQSEAQAKEELETTLYFHRIALAHRELLENNLLKAEELLDQCPSDLRAWEWYYLKRLCHVEPVTLRGQPGWAQTAAFSPDGRLLASAGDDKTVKVWEATTGQEVLVLPDTGEVFCAAFRPPEGRWLVTGDRNGAVTVWDTTTRQMVRTLGRHKAIVRSLAFSPEGGRLASASEDQTVMVWDATTGALVHHLSGHVHMVVTVAFSPDGQLLASGSFDRTVRIWDTTTGQPIRTLRGHEDPVYGVAFSPDGRRLASASFDRTVKIWDVSTGQGMLTLRDHSQLLFGVAFLDGGRRLTSVSLDKTVKIWDATTGAVLLTLRGHTQPLTGLVCSPDGRRLASMSLDRTTRIWDATPLEEAPVRPESLTLRGHTDQIWDLAFSPDGRRLASASYDKTVRVWDAQTGQEKLTFGKHIHIAFSVAFSPDGQRIASGSVQFAESEPSYLQIWDATTGQVVLQPRGSSVEAFFVAFSPDKGRWIVTGNQRGEVTVWDATTGQVVHTFGSNGFLVNGLAFSPDGRRLASLSGDGRVTVYDTTGWPEKFPQEPLLSFRAHKASVRGSLAFSQDGRRLVVPADDNAITIWDVMTTGERRVSAPQLTLRGHTARVCGVAFSPNDRWIASGGEDNTVKLWDATTGGEPLRTFRGHSALVSRVAFSPDGKHLASASFDKTVKVWDLTPLQEKPGPKAATPEDDDDE